MVNSSTNINKTSNHLSPKESLNSDGQHFHQYQQNKQSPLTIYLLCYNIVGKGSQAPLAEHETDGMDQQQDESMKQTHDFGTISSKGTLNVLFKDKKLDITTM